MQAWGVGVRCSQNLQLNLDTTDTAEHGFGVTYNENTNPHLLHLPQAKC